MNLKEEKNHELIEILTILSHRQSIYLDRRKLGDKLYNYETNDIVKIIQTFNTLDFAYIFYATTFDYKNQNEVSLAFMNITEALKLNAKSSYAYSVRGEIYLHCGMIDLASNDCLKAIELDPTDPYPIILLSQIFLEKNDTQEALNCVNKAITLDPNYDFGYAVRSKIYYAQKNVTTALKDLETAIHLDPMQASNYVEYYNIVMTQTMSLDALVNIMTSALEHCSDNALFYYYRASANFKLNKFDLVIGDLLIAVGMAPTSVESYLLLGQTYSCLGNNNSAIDCFSHCIALDPKSADAYTFRSVSYSNSQQYQLALEDINEAIEIDSTNPYLYIHKSGLLLELAGLTSAIVCVSKGIEMSPKNPDLILKRAELFYLNKEFIKCYNDFAYLGTLIHNDLKQLAKFQDRCKNIIKSEEHKKLVEFFNKTNLLKQNTHPATINQSLQQINLTIDSTNNYLKSVNSKDYFFTKKKTPTSLKFLCKAKLIHHFSEEEVSAVVKNMPDFSFLKDDVFSEDEQLEKNALVESTECENSYSKKNKI